MTTEYAAALEASRVAYRKFDAVRNDYRALKVGDAEFLAAKAEYEESEKAFDAAFAKASAPIDAAMERL
jgi:hypothetical protein